MPNIAAVLKEEIVRLARREVRRQTEKLRRGTLQHRKSIANLNRAIQELKRQVTLTTAQARRTDATSTVHVAPRVRFSATGLRSQRERLGLSAASFGRVLGVSSQTIYNWEHGIVRPAARQLTAIASARTMGKREARLHLERLETSALKSRRKS